MKVHSSGLLAVVAAWFVCPSLSCQQIPDRATLNAILGGSGTNEAFEALTVIFPGAAAVIGPTLDRTTTFGAQGPGLVAAGVTYGAVGGDLLWPEQGYGSLTSGALLTSLGTSGPMTIDYAIPVVATGMDVMYAQQLFGGFSAVVTFRGPGGNVLGTVPVAATAPNVPTFVGWTAVGGIASVEIASVTAFHKATIDDHAYGLDQASASDVVPFGSGCYEHFASFYEDHDAFDLSNTSLAFTLTNGSYVVQPTTSPVASPTGPPLIWGYGVFPLALGWTFPYPGGTTQDLYVGSEGFVRLSNVTTPQMSLLTQGPQFAARASSYLPSSGSVYFETDPVAQTATVTFSQFGESGAPFGSNTFQYHFDGQGNVELRFGACVAGVSTTGWSPGAPSLDPGSVDISSLGVIAPAPADVRPLALVASDFPVIGSGVDLVIDHVPTGSPATVHVVGFTEFSPGIDLAVLGMPGCFGHVSPDFLMLSPAPAASTSTYLLAIPNQPALIGQTVSAQGLAFDVLGMPNPFGAISSNALRLTLGQF
ncbi:MAG: hypothetical protein KAI24_12150 [Planctomycetes bacterium]|nr:hypothetical protein [Planctomycetota bacterium]